MPNSNGLFWDECNVSSRISLKHNKKNDRSISDILNQYITRGIISLDEVVGLEKEAVINQIIKKVHKYAISQTTNGRWITYVADSKKTSGRRLISKRTKAQLEAFLLEFYAIPEESPQVASFAELFQKLILYKKKFLNVSNTRKGISPTTIRRYERDYGNYIAGSELDKAEIAKITTISLEIMLVKIIETHDLSEKCANNMLSYVCQAFKFAVRNRYLDKDPSEFIDRRLILSRCRIRPAKDDSERVLTLNELKALRQAVLRHEEAHPEYVADYAIELAMLTGMRVGELAALHWGDIDDDWIHVDYSEHRLDYADRPSEIVVGEPKNYKHRKIPMTDDIRSLFAKVKRLGFNSPEGYVFCRKDGARCTAHTIGSAVARRASEAGIEKTSIHEIRRTVSSYLRQELPIKAVASMLGHLETTNELCYNYDMSETAEKTRALTELSKNLIIFNQVKTESQKQKKTGTA